MILQAKGFGKGQQAGQPQNLSLTVAVAGSEVPQVTFKQLKALRERERGRKEIGRRERERERDKKEGIDKERMERE